MKWKWNVFSRKYKWVISFYLLSFSFSVQTLHVDLDMLILSFGEISETSMVCNAQFCWDKLRIALFGGLTSSALSLFAFIFLVYFSKI